MSFIGKRVTRRLRIGLAIGQAIAVATVSLATGGTASAAPIPPLPKERSIHRPPMPTAKVPSKTQKPPVLTRKMTLAGYELKQSDLIDIHPGQALAVGVRCSDGMSVLGGGAYNTSAGGVDLTDTYPQDLSSTESGWYTWTYNRTGIVNQVRAYAICGRGVSRYEVRHSGYGTITGGRWGGRIACSAGDLSMISGGISNSSTTGSILNNSIRADTHLNNWENTVIKSTEAPQSIQHHVVCGTGLPGFQYRWSPYTVVPAGGYIKVTSLPCPEGTTVIGGYGESSAGIITDSYPEGNAWTLYFRSGYNGPDAVSADAVCAG